MAVLRDLSAGVPRKSGGPAPIDLGDLAREADHLRRHAREQADAILAQARAERDRLIASAAAEGHAQGLARGIELGTTQGREAGRAEALAEHRDRLTTLEASWASGLDALAAQRELVLAEAKRELLGLALDIASRVVRRAFDADPALIQQQVAALLEQIGRPVRLIIEVHADDLPLVQDAMPALVQRFGGVSGVEVRADPSAPRGSCTGRLPAGGEIDAGVHTQLQRIAEAVLPRGERP